MQKEKNVYLHTHSGGLSYGVMVAQLVLVQLVEVRTLVRQQIKKQLVINALLFFVTE